MPELSLRSARNRIVIVALIALSTTLAWSASYKILHGFSGRLASNPSSGLVVDKAGNGYGATSAGGFNNAGTVYQISPKTGFSVIYGFSGPDGRQPQGNLVIDAGGNLYGTTVYGGANKTGCNNQGCGTVFRLSPSANGGTWTETVLYSFVGADDGSNPQAGVVLDSEGNLYGTTEFGGNGGCGAVFQLTPGANDQWTETVVYAIGEGCNALGSLIFDSSGNLYGTVSTSGPNAGGLAFELSPQQNGTWLYTRLYAFNGFSGSKDAAGPQAGLTFDTEGNLYGATVAGGDFGFGAVFELIPAQGQWTEKVLYSFSGGSDGATPEASLVFDAVSNLYGTTVSGGSPGFSCLGHGCGTVFQLTPGGNGQWTERHFTFPGSGDLGIQPTSPLILDKTGHVYGTTTSGGPLGEGVIFRISR